MPIDHVSASVGRIISPNAGLRGQDLSDHLGYAKLAGYVDRSIVVYAQMCPKGERFPGDPLAQPSWFELLRSKVAV